MDGPRTLSTAATPNSLKNANPRSFSPDVSTVPLKRRSTEARFTKTVRLDPNIATIFSEPTHALKLMEKARCTPIEPKPPSMPNQHTRIQALKPHRRTLKEIIQSTSPGCPFPREIDGSSLEAARMCKQVAKDRVDNAESRIFELVDENVKATQFQAGQLHLRKLQVTIRQKAREEDAKRALSQSLAQLEGERTVCVEKTSRNQTKADELKRLLDSAKRKLMETEKVRSKEIENRPEFTQLSLVKNAVGKADSLLQQEIMSCVAKAYEEADEAGLHRRDVDRLEVIEGAILDKNLIPSLKDMEVVRNVVVHYSKGSAVRDWPTDKKAKTLTVKGLRSLFARIASLDWLENYNMSGMPEDMLNALKKVHSAQEKDICQRLEGMMGSVEQSKDVSNFPFLKLSQFFVNSLYEYYLPSLGGANEDGVLHSPRDALKDSCAALRAIQQEHGGIQAKHKKITSQLKLFLAQNARLEGKIEECKVKLATIESSLQEKEGTISSLERSLNELNVDNESLASSRARSICHSMQSRINDKMSQFCRLKDTMVMLITLSNFDAIETKDGVHHSLIAVSEMHLIATPIINGHGGKIIMCSGLCDNMPGILVCIFERSLDAVEAAISIKRDWEAVSVREDFDIKLHDALYGRRRSHKEKYSKKCGKVQEGQHSVSRNLVPDVEICIGCGDLWHLGGHGIVGKEVSVAYHLLRERVRRANLKEKSPEHMVKLHSVWGTMGAHKSLNKELHRIHNEREFRLSVTSYHIPGQREDEQLCKCTFKNNLSFHETEEIRHRILISISKGFHRTLDPVVNSGDDYDFLRLLSARRNCTTEMSAVALDTCIRRKYLHHRIVVSVALHGGPLPWNREAREGDHTAVGMFPGAMFHAHSLIGEQDHTTPQTMLEYSRNLMAFKRFVRGVKSGIRRLDLGIAPHGMMVFHDVKSAMDVVNQTRKMFLQLNLAYDTEANRLPDAKGPIRGELSIAIAAGRIYDFEEEDLYGYAPTKARLLSEDDQITGKTVIDVSAIHVDPELFATLYGVDLGKGEKRKIQRHMGEPFYVYQ